MRRRKKRIKGIMKVFMRRAEKGAALMDVCLPAWHWQIDTDILNLGNEFDCILGQCFWSYSRGVKILLVEEDEEIHRGFFLRKTESRNYSLLTACWKKLINQRLANDKKKTRTAVALTRSKNAPQRNQLATHAV